MAHITFGGQYTAAPFSRGVSLSAAAVYWLNAEIGSIPEMFSRRLLPSTCRSCFRGQGLPRQSEDSVGDVAVDAGTARAVPAGDANRSVVLESEGAGIDGYEEDNPEDLVTRALARIGGIAFTG